MLIICKVFSNCGCTSIFVIFCSLLTYHSNIKCLLLSYLISLAILHAISCIYIQYLNEWKTMNEICIFLIIFSSLLINIFCLLSFVSVHNLQAWSSSNQAHFYDRNARVLLLGAIMPTWFTSLIHIVGKQR